ncbi:sugar ABC transporter substrate-binding protein [Rhodobacterales bacterium 52_120_T64]|nr:sugar ABC transporter substrate-binding protein [Rhodobacterales bacterium 52_120_T64]
MNTTKLVSALLATSFLGTAAFAQDVTITVESWRNDDLLIWQNTIIPAFEAGHPGIKVVFAPTAPAQYNSALNAKLAAGTAGDLITCRPFDGSLSLYDAGHLADVGGLENMANFGPVAKSGWSTDDGSATFCVPMASVIHGFIYNKEAFEEVGVDVPNTTDEFFAVLDAFKEDGNYIPLSMGTADQWEAATMGYANIGPNYWKGEEGRMAVIAGDQKLTDPQWVAPYAQLARWGEYMGDGFEAQSYPDSQNLFTLGRAAIYPAGSWELSGFNAQAEFAMGAFNPPVQAAGDECYISDHVDIALGMNSATKNADEVRTFLNWVGTAEFASLYANSLPGFFSLSNHTVEMSDPLAQEIVGWRNDCNSSIRPYHQILSRGTPNLANEYWVSSANAIRGSMTPEEAGAHMQDGLASWYEPQQ